MAPAACRSECGVSITGRNIDDVLTATQIQERPTRDWTLDLLAKDVGLSRSSLAERFTEFVGTPPMQYLQKWRLQIAASKLAEGISNIATIAAEIGYESEAAFSRAFKRSVGTPPAEWRSKRLSSSAIARS